MHLRLTLSFIALVLPSTAAAQSLSGAHYEVRFDATWSAATHPGAYPNGAHFSPPIGGTHSSAFRMWEAGELASANIEDMAETGNHFPLADDIDAAILAGTAGERIQGNGFNSPNTRTYSFFITQEHPLVSLVTMIAPSPDWFVGIDSLSLRENGEWIELIVPLYAWDSGTDSGVNFTSPNANTNPAEPISLITGGPFFGNDPLGTLTFTRVGLGDNYCGPAVPNSTGQSGEIIALGSGVAGDSLTLAGSDLPANRLGYFLVSATPGSIFPAGSVGQLCLSGTIGRLNRAGEVGSTSPAGSLSVVLDTLDLPLAAGMVQAGETWNFQAWHRDAGGTSNFTDAVSIQF